MSSADEHAPHVDPVTGMMTTGHEWDGIAELNTPLPKWWLYIFYATIVWAFGYYIVYPSWPLATDYMHGVWNWSSRGAVTADVQEMRDLRKADNEKLAAMPIADVLKDPAMLSFAQAEGKAAFGDNCAPCHGAGGGGAVGYPNLTDDDWLWGGTPEKILETITVGIRSTDENTRPGNMPAFGEGASPTLTKAQIGAVADYVRSLSKLDATAPADLAEGQKVFSENCAVCHGEDGKGNQDLGSANLTDKIWLYGSDKATIEAGVIHGHGGVMPTWKGKFDKKDPKIDEAIRKSLAVYVYTLGGGQK